MDCEEVRAALSARLDGERTSLPDDVIDAHLEVCEECQRWYTTVTALGRSLSIGPIGTQPDPFNSAPDPAQTTDRVLAAADTMPVVASRVSRRQLPLTIARIALIFLTLIYLIWAGLLLLLFPSVSTSLNNDANDAFVTRLIMDAAVAKFALGLGLGCAAARPRISSAILPIYLAQWAFGAGFATREVVLGFMESHAGYGLVSNPIWGLLVHLCAVVALLTCWVGRNHMFTPLKQSWRTLTARPVNFSPADLEEHSSFRLGDNERHDLNQRARKDNES